LKVGSWPRGTIQTCPVPPAAITMLSPASESCGFCGGSGTLSSTLEVAGSTMSTLLSVRSKSSTVAPRWITWMSAPLEATTVSRASTWVLARPITWDEPLATHTDPSLRSRRCAV
jgi:hypothetical protein